MAGVESTTLTSNNIPAHTHTANYVNANGNSKGVSGGALAVVQGTNTNIYSNNTAPNTPLHASTIGPNSNGNQPFSIMPPYLALNFCIALEGIFPSRN
jgi:microcystin-dependent protein